MYLVMYLELLIVQIEFMFFFPPEDAGGGVTMGHTLQLSPCPCPHTHIRFPCHHPGRN